MCSSVVGRLTAGLVFWQYTAYESFRGNGPVCQLTDQVRTNQNIQIYLRTTFSLAEQGDILISTA